MKNHYLSLAIMALLSFVSMFVLMYAMVDTFDSVYANLNQVYMAALMTAPMVIIELLVMGAMYHNKKLNLAIIAVAVVAMIGSWFAIRQQAAISDSQFLRSMIPHHSGAILMCEQASISDPEIKRLCAEIVKGQADEIRLMKELLDR